jgi:hypothetical protein
MKVDVCKIRFYIYREVRDPQLGIIGSNRRLLLGYGDSITYPVS